MKKYLTKDTVQSFLSVLFSGISLTAASCLAVNWFLTHIGWMLAAFGQNLGLTRLKTKQFSKSFSLLTEASIDFPLLLTLLLCLAVVLLGRYLIRKRNNRRKLRIAATILLCFFLLLPVLVLTLLFTHVNGVRFDLVLKQLILLV